MALKNVKNDLIPMLAGVVRVTPLNEQGVPQFDKSYTTKRDYLVSTQHSVTRATETLGNGNGPDGEYPMDEVHNLTVNTNVYDQKFHNMLTGAKKDDTAHNVLYDTTVIPKKSSGEPAAYEYEFTEAKLFPVASDDGAVHIEIKDNNGNRFTDVTAGGELAEGNFKYDDSTHKLTFAAAYENVPLSCSYYYSATAGETFEAPAVLKNFRFMLEVMGEMQSAETGEQERYYAKITRAVVSGDLPGVTTQKQITNTIAYNFKSAPVPKGVVPFTETITPISAEETTG